MSKGRLIAFTGRSGAGKDTAAAALLANGFERVAFADPLKAGLAAMLGIKRAKLEVREYKEAVLPELGKSPREMMQTLGTEWGRKLVGENVWVSLAMRGVDLLLDSGIDVVMTDCRFVNEAAAVHARGGKVIEIRRDGESGVPAHASEQGLPLDIVDMVIRNTSSTPERFAALVAATLGIENVQRALDLHDRVTVDPVQAMAQFHQRPAPWNAATGSDNPLTGRYPAELIAASTETALEAQLRKERERAKQAVGEVTAKVEQDFSRFNRSPRLADGV